MSQLPNKTNNKNKNRRNKTNKNTNHDTNTNKTSTNKNNTIRIQLKQSNQNKQTNKYNMGIHHNNPQKTPPKKHRSPERNIPEKDNEKSKSVSPTKPPIHKYNNKISNDNSQIRQSQPIPQNAQRQNTQPLTQRNPTIQQQTQQLNPPYTTYSNTLPHTTHTNTQSNTRQNIFQNPNTPITPQENQRLLSLFTRFIQSNSYSPTNQQQFQSSFGTPTNNIYQIPQRLQFHTNTTRNDINNISTLNTSLSTNDILNTTFSPNPIQQPLNYSHSTPTDIQKYYIRNHTPQSNTSSQNTSFIFNPTTQPTNKVPPPNLARQDPPLPNTNKFLDTTEQIDIIIPSNWICQIVHKRIITKADFVENVITDIIQHGCVPNVYN